MPVKSVEEHTQKSSVTLGKPKHLQNQLTLHKHVGQEKLQVSSNLLTKNSVVTPIKADRLDYWLKGYDRNKQKYLVEGFKVGFKIPFEGQRIFRESDNLKSAKDNLDILKQKIQIEIDNHRVAGPFKEIPFQNFQSSPLDLVPKKSGETIVDYRVKHHLSYPEGCSVNDGIQNKFKPVQYQEVEDAVGLMRTYGKNCGLLKLDIQNTYKIVPIHCSDWELLGFTIDHEYYFDKTLPMGLSFSCQLFEEFSTAVHWVCENKLGLSGRLVHLLDDFLGVGPEDRQICYRDLNKIMFLFKDIGIPIKESKIVRPCTSLIFLGIELDSILMEKRLPQDKLTKARHLIQIHKSKKSITLQELQSIIGLLNFACSVVIPGRPFLRRLIDLSIGLTKPFHHRRLNKEARADLNAWGLFLEHFNGKSLFLSEQWDNSDSLQLYTDASNIGFGGYLGNQYFSGIWPKTWNTYHITIKELFPIVLAVQLWADQLENRCIIFFTDNDAVVHIINKQSSKEKTIMVLVRRLVAQCLKHNILFQARHVPGLDNVLADHLSRQQIPQFLQKFSHNNPVACHYNEDNFKV
ncbi:uncharacterized protein LOC134249476 [Saccostrea cucullata]|uniref:uncharacterized protein LOC134249476 n=1 Tax=Saccostrea cuccullata TaxID=36930 RepID=UPI002ED2C3B2